MLGNLKGVNSGEGDSAGSNQPSRSGRDRRHSKRVPYGTKVILRWADQQAEVQSINLSVSGIFVETTAALRAGSMVVLRFLCDGRRVDAMGRVVRCVTPEAAKRLRLVSGLGIEFQKLLAGQEELEKFIAHRVQPWGATPRLRATIHTKEGEPGGSSR